MRGLTHRGTDEPDTQRNRSLLFAKQRIRTALERVGELERLRTQAILARNLPSAPAVIFDVGAQQENRIGYAGGNVQMASVALGD
jgi:hypothetical protein